MRNVVIMDDAFELAPMLREVLACARVETARAGTPTEGAPRCEVFVASARQEAALGGTRALVEQARREGARAMMVVDETSETFGLTTEMNGKLTRLALGPGEGAPANGPEDVCHVFRAFLVASLLKGARGVLARDPASLKLYDMAERVARAEVSVFINGPTGSGKEVLAQFIHDRSPRASGPFIAINCAAIPENMLEAMLFGHEKGAFTGASSTNKGIFRAADGGTLLLDEISEMPMMLQAKLLRALQERVVTPIGSSTPVPVDVRVLATSNRNMHAEIKTGKFREDLFYRLNVFPLITEPLARRRDDIIPIAAALLVRHHKDPTTLPRLERDALEALLAHDWPGNVRELDNVIQRAAVLQTGGRVTGNDIMVDFAPPPLSEPAQELARASSL